MKKALFPVVVAMILVFGSWLICSYAGMSIPGVTSEELDAAVVAAPGTNGLAEVLAIGSDGNNQDITNIKTNEASYFRTGQSELYGDTSFLYINAGGTESVKIGGTDGNTTELISLSHLFGGTVEINLIQSDNSIVANQSLAELWFSGTDGGLAPGAKIKAIADDDWAVTDCPTRLEFLTCPDGSGTLATRMVIKEDGDVGIGTNAPSNILHLQGGAQKLGFSRAAYDTLAIYQSAPTGPGSEGLHWYNVSDTAYIMAIQESGNVGIGTNNPAEILHVNGNVRIDNQAFSDEIYQITYTGTNVAWDCDNGNLQYVVLTNDAQLANPSNLERAGYTIFVQQDGTGSRTLSYGTWYDWGDSGEPTLTTTGGDEDIISLIGRDADTIYASSKLGFTP